MVGLKTNVNIQHLQGEVQQLTRINMAITTDPNLLLFELC